MILGNIKLIVKRLRQAMAIVEEGDTASQSIAKDKYVMWKGILCKTDSAIPQGGTFATSGAGKNLTAKTEGLGGEIATLNSNIIDMLYPIGSIYMSLNNTMPTALTAGRTWEMITGGYVLKTISSGTGGTLSNAGNTGDTTIDLSFGIAKVVGGTNRINWLEKNSGSQWTDNYALGGTFSSASAGQAHSYGAELYGSQAHHHTAGMPANVSVYMWKRTA